MKDIAIYGAGGFGREVACLINSINTIKPTWNLIGFFDDSKKIGNSNEFGKVIGGINELNGIPKPLSVVIAIGNPKYINSICNRIDNKLIDFPNLIAPDTLIFDNNSFRIGVGNIITFKCIVSCNVCIGNFNILNSDVFLGHDVNIGSNNVFNPSTRISGEVTIGNCNTFGVASIILQQKRIGNNTTIGANSLIIKNTRDDSLYHGNPAIRFNF